MHSNANPQNCLGLSVDMDSPRRNLARATSVDPYTKHIAGMTKYGPRDVNMPRGNNRKSAIPPTKLQGASPRCLHTLSDQE